ncbi:MAG: hypothetical protein KVP17_003441 [Porospora cf. gigantea B]|uniref:uncharacterized protein n=1 Tax=Porospora cf. gigantea B TaxID=2853592 RepID=UPI00357199D1|nr:MAG: hypothetical protein KVP17_003441 [Porospora cf. gigantea B]
MTIRVKAEVSQRRAACKSKVSYRPKDVIEISDTDDSTVEDVAREKEINLLDVTDDEMVRLLRRFGPKQQEPPPKAKWVEPAPPKAKWAEPAEKLKDSIRVQSSLSRNDRRRVESSSPESGALLCDRLPPSSGSRVITRPSSSRVIFCNVRLH